eukprot:scaffold119795_cov24-Tisochrysis_lutea.AAC.2
MTVYFSRMEKLRHNNKLDSRIRFMIQDVLDLRSTKWVPRTKKEGPKKIEVRHAGLEKQQWVSRGKRMRSQRFGVELGVRMVLCECWAEMCHLQPFRGVE